MGRSHSGGPRYGGGGQFDGSMLPNINQSGHYNSQYTNGQRASNSYPLLANGSKAAATSNFASSAALGASSSDFSRSPSAGVSGRVDWKSKYLK